MCIDLHNHTLRCNHATGNMHEYVDRALFQGVTVYGFSCHAPMEYDMKFRMGFDELKDYLKDIEEMQKRYEGICEIRSGFEVDFLEGYIDNRVIDAKVDYLIGSVHFLGHWGFDNPEFIAEYAKKDMNECWLKYLLALQHMAKSRLFDIVGHFDLLKIFNYPPSSMLNEAIYETLECIKMADMVLEINTAGLRKPIAEMYPSMDILKIAHSLGIPITIGSDAHSVEQVGFGRIKALQAALDAGYKEIVDIKEHERIPLSIEYCMDMLQ